MHPLEIMNLLLFMSACIVLAVIDFRSFTLPNRVLYSATAAAAMIWLADAALSKEWQSLLYSFDCAAITFVLFLIFTLLAAAVGTKSFLGMGDVKFAAYIALVLGFWGIAYPVLALVLASASGALHSSVLIFFKNRQSQRVPTLLRAPASTKITDSLNPHAYKGQNRSSKTSAALQANIIPYGVHLALGAAASTAVLCITNL